MSPTKTPLSSKDQICETALIAFGQYGYDGASVSKIAADAGVSQPNVHYHFKSKRALWEASMLYLGQSIEQDVAAQRKLYGWLTPLDKLKASCLVLIEDAARRPVLGQVILSEGQSGGERLDWLLRNVLSAMYYELAETIESCLQDKLIQPFAPHQLLMFLIGAAVTQFYVSPLVSAVVGEDPRTPDNGALFKDMYLEILLDGIILKKETP
mgnify:FL=1